MGCIFSLGVLNATTLEDQGILSQQGGCRLGVAPMQRSVESIDDCRSSVRLSAERIRSRRRRSLVCGKGRCHHEHRR
jgi:hypothetical protein